VRYNDILICMKISFFFFFFPHIGERAGAIQRHSEEWGAGGADCGRCYYRMCSLTIECVL